MSTTELIDRLKQDLDDRIERTVARILRIDELKAGMKRYFADLRCEIDKWEHAMARQYDEERDHAQAELAHLSAARGSSIEREPQQPGMLQ